MTPEANLRGKTALEGELVLGVTLRAEVDGELAEGIASGVLHAGVLERKGKKMIGNVRIKFRRVVNNWGLETCCPTVQPA